MFLSKIEPTKSPKNGSENLKKRGAHTVKMRPRPQSNAV